MGDESTITPRTVIREFLHHKDPSQSVLVARRRTSLRPSPAKRGSQSLLLDPKSRESNVGLKRRSSFSDVTPRGVIQKFLDSQQTAKPESRKRRRVEDVPDDAVPNLTTQKRRSSRIQPVDVETPGKDLTPRSVITGFLRQAVDQTPIHVQNQFTSERESLPPVPPEAELRVTDSPLNVTTKLRPRRSPEKVNAFHVRQHKAVDESLIHVQNQYSSRRESLPPIPPEAELLVIDSPLNVTTNLRPRRSPGKVHSFHVRQHKARLNLTLGGIDEGDESIVIPETQPENIQGTRTPRSVTGSRLTVTRTPRSVTRTPRNVTGSPRSVTGSLRSVTGSPRSVTGSPRTVTRTPRISTGTPQTNTGPPRTVTRTPRNVTGSPRSVTGSLRSVTGSPQSVTGSLWSVTRSPRTVTRTPRTSTGTPQTNTGTPRTETGTPRSITGSPRRSTDTRRSRSMPQEITSDEETEIREKGPNTTRLSGSLRGGKRSLVTETTDNHSSSVAVGDSSSANIRESTEVDSDDDSTRGSDDSPSKNTRSKLRDADRRASGPLDVTDAEKSPSTGIKSRQSLSRRRRSVKETMDIGSDLEPSTSEPDTPNKNLRNSTGISRRSSMAVNRSRISRRSSIAASLVDVNSSPSTSRDSPNTKNSSVKKRGQSVNEGDTTDEEYGTNVDQQQADRNSEHLAAKKPLSRIQSDEESFPENEGDENNQEANSTAEKNSGRVNNTDQSVEQQNATYDVEEQFVDPEVTAAGNGSNARGVGENAYHSRLRDEIAVEDQPQDRADVSEVRGSEKKRAKNSPKPGGNRHGAKPDKGTSAEKLHNSVISRQSIRDDQVTDDGESGPEDSPLHRRQYAPVKTPQTLQPAKRKTLTTPQSVNSLDLPSTPLSSSRLIPLPGKIVTSTPKPTKGHKSLTKSVKKRVIGNKKRANKGEPLRMPASYTRGLFSHFLKTKDVSKDVLQAVNKVADKFWVNLTSDLGAFADHAGRSTITEEDVELLLKRQGFVTEKRSMYTLVHQYLPLEHQQEIIPMARSGNKVVPSK